MQRWCAVLVAAGLLTGVAGPAMSQSTASGSLPDLIAQANREGALRGTVQASWGRTILPQLADAFKKRFGLTIDVTLTPSAPAVRFPLDIAETKAGGAPTYDVEEGDDAETMQLIGGGGVQAIPHWRDLLPAINPEVRARKVTLAQISRAPFEGTAFLFMANVKELLYNPKLTNPADLPKTHAELAEPKFAGKFVQPPWTAHWEMAPEMIKGTGRDRFIDLVRAAGKNGTVLYEAEGVNRVVLGQYPFVLAQDAFIRDTLARDPQAPIAGAFFRDYNQLNSVYYAVRARTPHPAAAALFALWMTTPEAEAIWQTINRSFVPYGSGAIDVAERATLKKERVPVVGYLDNAATIEYLQWQQTPEGARYLTAMAKALRGE